MKISIVIPVVNEAEQIAQAVDRAWGCGADQVIVSDGGSTDQTLARLDSVECDVVHSPPGRSIQMNRGAAAAKGDVLLFLHADNWLDPNACRQIREFLSNPSSEYGAFRQRIDHSKWIYRWIESGNRWRARWQGLIYGDQAFFIRSELFHRSGRFPEIELMEDFAFSRILRKYGNPVILEGPTVVNARRWERSGPIRQTLKNWFLSLAFRLGARPGWIAAQYRRHDDS